MSGVQVPAGPPKIRIMKPRKGPKSNVAWLSLGISVIAVLFSLPSAINQYNQVFREKSQYKVTEELYYSPPEPTAFVPTLQAESCWESIVSSRLDSYRCVSKKEILDPCFIVEDRIAKFYCPNSWIRDSEDVELLIDDSAINKRDPSIFLKEADEELPPWLIFLEDGTECRKTTGSRGVAYGNKGNIYSCKDKKYSSVTTGEIIDNKHYFACKTISTSYFKKCLATRVVY